MKENVIKICMGSSCFSRGNKENLESLKAYIRENSIDATVHLTGNLCEGKCNIGPNITINDKSFSGVDAKSLQSLLEKEILKVSDVQA